ncbi:ATP-dependent helicase [Erwinia psidii]|uniref:UvrD-helicase domain-containing protein n=1 Tax=Erwinia psidii TaxID=69224 RepID=UPI00226B48A6|nr:UvrD-helicase domain-containing protein [Erwinia psidii]MCX8959124.1 ATP-dependent helicase [Erwinia psidii]
MSFTLTDEQHAVTAWQGRHLVVNAFAGTGKTATLVSFAEANPDSRMLYLAYNRAIRDEAERKFPYNVECRTSHQLAWSHFGRHFRHRLSANLRITDVARRLNTRHWPLARLAMSGLNAFLCSADEIPGLTHLPKENDRHGIEVDKILGAVQVLWHEMSHTGSNFPVTHDVYLKLFQLSAPDLSERWDTILFDEAQDANPVTSAFVLNQPCRVILVGDRWQQIYRFRGADNALCAPQLAQANRLWLTSSFRFGPEIARVANILLTRAGEDKEVTGLGGADEVLTRLPDDIPHYAVLSRTVAGVIGAALTASLENKRVFWVGGIEGYKTDELEDLYWFQAEMPEKMRSTRVSRDWRDFDEYCQVAKATQDVEMNQAIRLLDDFFPLPQKLAVMRRFATTQEQGAQVTVSTAHRSKGLEWPVVMLNEDFTDITDPLLAEDERRDETCLLYVAVTRAREKLVTNKLVCSLVESSNSARD